MRLRRAGFSLVEISVAVGVFSLILYILMAATRLASMYFLSDQLSHAIQGALVLSSELEEDLRQAIRDPETGKAVHVLSGADSACIAFYRGLARPGQMMLAAVPVRWSLKTDPGTKYGYLVRTTFDPDGNRWRTTEHRWAPIPVPGSPGNPPGANPFGFRIEGDTKSLVQTVFLTVMARTQKVEMAGAVQDRATVQISVAVPKMPRVAKPLFQAARKIEEIPAD